MVGDPIPPCSYMKYALSVWHYFYRLTLEPSDPCKFYKHYCSERWWPWSGTACLATVWLFLGLQPYRNRWLAEWPLELAAIVKGKPWKGNLWLERKHQPPWLSIIPQHAMEAIAYFIRTFASMAWGICMITTDSKYFYHVDKKWPDTRLSLSGYFKTD